MISDFIPFLLQMRMKREQIFPLDSTYEFKSSPLLAVLHSIKREGAAPILRAKPGSSTGPRER